ncbi:hypothetical protein AAG570_009368 [Ranatra chinensis]|uniref:Nuclear hormone receptor HR96 n=1 Tax=Ranatra chinensis TaxID=642074 RepID=A0ABD0YNY7_9HEMI
MVCGDHALGYNFNAITCESCKAFFRRNASKQNSLRCHFKQSCQITSVTRRFCQQCRLAKCFQVGMKRELIMTEEDKERKRIKIEANRARAATKNNCESLLDVINLTAVAIRRLIKMCKRLPEFRWLPQQDQLSLLKHGCTQMMLLRSVVTFDPDRNSWKIPHSVDQMSRIRVEVLKEARGNIYEAHEAFLRSFDPRASTDINIINMLTAVTLFDPDRPNLLQRDAIRQQQEAYYELLQRYLETQFSEGDARAIYRHLIHKIGELHRLNEDHVRVYLDVNPSQVEPLLIEIFDLKPH